MTGFLAARVAQSFLVSYIIVRFRRYRYYRSRQRFSRSNSLSSTTSCAQNRAPSSALFKCAPVRSRARRPRAQLYVLRAGCLAMLWVLGACAWLCDICVAACAPHSAMAHAMGARCDGRSMRWALDAMGARRDGRSTGWRSMRWALDGMGARRAGARCDGRSTGWALDAMALDAMALDAMGARRDGARCDGRSTGWALDALALDAMALDAMGARCDGARCDGARCDGRSMRWARDGMGARRDGRSTGWALDGMALDAMAFGCKCSARGAWRFWVIGYWRLGTG